MITVVRLARPSSWTVRTYTLTTDVHVTTETEDIT